MCHGDRLLPTMLDRFNKFKRWINNVFVLPFFFSFLIGHIKVGNKPTHALYQQCVGFLLISTVHLWRRSVLILILNSNLSTLSFCLARTNVFFFYKLSCVYNSQFALFFKNYLYKVGGRVH